MPARLEARLAGRPPGDLATDRNLDPAPPCLVPAGVCRRESPELPPSRARRSSASSSLMGDGCLGHWGGPRNLTEPALCSRSFHHRASRTQERLTRYPAAHKASAWCTGCRERTEIVQTWRPTQIEWGTMFGTFDGRKFRVLLLSLPDATSLCMPLGMQQLACFWIVDVHPDF